MAVVVKENTDIDEYHSIFAKLKKLHDIAKTNEKESGEEGQSDENKLTSKRKTELDFDGLSDDSPLNSSVNKTKRRRYSDSQDYSVRGDFNIRDYCNDTSNKGGKKYILTLSNLPGEWTYEKIKQYVTEECGVDVLKMTDSRSQKSNYQLRLRFTNEEQYKSVVNKLRNKEVDGKLKLEIEDESDTDSGDSDTTMCIAKSEIKTEDTSWMSNIDVWDPEGLYGLKPEFLRNLNIVPPLVKWINVTNFRCDKSELRDVFEMAGRVVICVVVHTMNKYAKIMYSHPLEAVQAVSMLNGQTFYGQSLKVVMDPFAENTLPLPKGLQNLGPGLGAMGKPLRDVVVEFERFVKGKDSTINASLFGKSDENVSEVSMERSSPSKPSSSEGFGQFGAIGQRKVVTNSTAPNEPDHATSPRPGPSNVPTSSLGQNSPPMYPNPLASNLLGGRAFQQQPQNTPLLSSPPVEQYRYMGPQNFPSPYGQAGQHNVPYAVPNPGQHQFPTGPNYQDPTGLKVQGPTANFLGQCGQFGPNPAQHGQNFQNPAQLNVAHNPQFPMSNFRPNAQFMNQNVPMGPMSNMSGPSPGMVEPVQNCTNLGPRPNAPLPVPAPNMLTPVPAPRMTSGPFQGPNVLPQGPHELPLGSNGQNQGPNGPPQGMHGPFLGPNGPFQGPNGPNQGPNRPGQGQRNNNLPTVMVLKSKNPVALQITNLPEHVNFASLCGRLSKVGQVVSLDFTTPGCAVVKFDNPSEAERCFQYYSPSRYGHELGLI